MEQFRQIARFALEREGELSPILGQQLEQRARELKVHPLDMERVLQEVLALPSVRAVQACRAAERRVQPRRQTGDPVFERLKVLIMNQLGVDSADITLEARFREDLKADSLDLVELVMAIEEEFGMAIPDEDAQKITTVGEAVEYVRQVM